MNKTTIYALAIAAGLTAGCQSDTDKLFRNVPEAQYRDVEIVGPSNASNATIMRIGKYNGHGFGGDALIYAIDRDGVKGFDELTVYDASKSDSIRNLASINTLDSLLKTLTGPNAPKPSDK
jgi:hypothetical protein